MGVNRGGKKITHLGQFNSFNKGLLKSCDAWHQGNHRPPMVSLNWLNRLAVVVAGNTVDSIVGNIADNILVERGPWLVVVVVEDLQEHLPLLLLQW